jgi:hypothetical protein
LYSNITRLQLPGIGRGLVSKGLYPPPLAYLEYICAGLCLEWFQFNRYAAFLKNIGFSAHPVLILHTARICAVQWAAFERGTSKPAVTGDKPVLDDTSCPETLIEAVVRVLSALVYGDTRIRFRRHSNPPHRVN